MEDVLLSSREALSTVLDAVDDPLLVLDTSGTIRLTNRALLSRLGFCAEALLGQHLSRLHPPDCEQPIEQMLADATAGRVVRHELPLVAQDGTRVPVETRVVCLQTGASPFWLLISRNLDEQRPTLEDLRRERELVRAILESSPCAITITSLDGVIQDCNTATWQAAGFSSKAEVVDRNVLDLIVEEHHTQAIENMIKTYQRGVVRNQRYGFYDAEGNEYPGEVSVAVLRGPDGTPTGFVNTTQDVTERRRLENQLHQSWRTEIVGRLARGVSHDFNNILTAIRGYASFALETMPEDHVARPDIAEVMRATERAEILTRQLLAFSRRQLLYPTKLQLDAVVLDLAGLLRRLVTAEVELVILPVEDLWPVRADSGQIEQVIINLTAHARDAMPQGGKLLIELKNARIDPGEADDRHAPPPGDYVLLSIRHPGAELSEKAHQRNLNPSLENEKKGDATGLDLSTLTEIVRQHEGHFHVESQPGRGTEFQIHLPRAMLVPKHAQRADPQTPVPGGDETVLVVEDEPLVKAVTVRSLAGLGYHILEADNGEEALRLAVEHDGEIDLLVTDLVMPRMGGKELDGKLRDAYPNLRTLFVSGYSGDVLARHGVRLDRSAFLQKPFTLRTLAQAVRNALA